MTEQTETPTEPPFVAPPWVLMMQALADQAEKDKEKNR